MCQPEAITWAQESQEGRGERVHESQTFGQTKQSEAAVNADNTAKFKSLDERCEVDMGPHECKTPSSYIKTW